LKRSEKSTWRGFETLVACMKYCDVITPLKPE
jgi:hypothetical protein